MQKKILFLILTALLPFIMSAQITLQTYTSATDTFYWKQYIHIPKPARINLQRYTAAGSGKIINRFVSLHADQFPQFFADTVVSDGIRELKKGLYAIEISGDKLTDIVYSGFSGGPSDIVRIFVNRGDSFELVFEDYQYLSAFMKQNGQLIYLQTGDIGSGDDYLYFTRDYRVRTEAGNLMFVKGKQTVAYKYTEEPTASFSRPASFESVADTMMVRASAARLNEPFIPRLDTFGNIVAKYRTKTRGDVLAMKTTGKGNTWYYVEIYPASKPSASILYQNDQVPLFLRGWVSGLSIRIE
jgi:hypothetical protein